MVAGADAGGNGCRPGHRRRGRLTADVSRGLGAPGHHHHPQAARRLQTEGAVRRRPDDYHCTLLIPHVTQNSYIISSQFFPGQRRGPPRHPLPRPPGLAATAERDNVERQRLDVLRRGPPARHGLAQISEHPVAQRLGSRHTEPTTCPRAPGSVLPAGSLVVMQVHYNLLVGDKPVKNSLVLHTVPVRPRCSR